MPRGFMVKRVWTDSDEEGSGDEITVKKSKASLESRLTQPYHDAGGYEVNGRHLPTDHQHSQEQTRQKLEAATEINSGCPYQEWRASHLADLSSINSKNNTASWEDSQRHCQSCWHRSEEAITPERDASRSKPTNFRDVNSLITSRQSCPSSPVFNDYRKFRDRAWNDVPESEYENYWKLTNLKESHFVRRNRNRSSGKISLNQKDNSKIQGLTSTSVESYRDEPVVTHNAHHQIKSQYAQHLGSGTCSKGSHAAAHQINGDNGNSQFQIKTQRSRSCPDPYIDHQKCHELFGVQRLDFTPPTGNVQIAQPGTVIRPMNYTFMNDGARACVQTEGGADQRQLG